MSIKTVVKSDGTRVDFDSEKLHKWAKFASENNVAWSSIALGAYRKCYDGCSTQELHQAMIDVCIEKEDSKHLRMAGRLLLGTIYKEAHGGYRQIPTLKDFYHDMVNRGLWVEMDYSDEELEKLEEVINHDINLSEVYNYTVLKQMRDKYLSQDLTTGLCHESPQFMFMGVALQSMEGQPKDRRLEDVAKTYKYLSELKINLSTPMLVNLRTPKKGLASCCVYTAGDTAESLAVGDHIAYMMTCASAGIGSHFMTRSKGDPVRQGAVVHQGDLPYLRMIQSAVHANKQACYDDQTEVLTNNGFKLFSDLTDEDMVAQVHDNGQVDFVYPTNEFVYDFDGELVSFERDNGDKFLVTDNHKMVYIDNSPISMNDWENNELGEMLVMKDASELDISDDKMFMVSGTKSIRDTSSVDRLDLTFILLKLLGTKSNGKFKIHIPDVGENRNSVLNSIENLLHLEGVGFKKGDEGELVINSNDEKLQIVFNRGENIITRLGESHIHELFKYAHFLFTGEEDTEEYRVELRNDSIKNLVFSLVSVSGLTIEKLGDQKYLIRSGMRFIPTSNYKKDVEKYKGKVYCVEVPTHMLIVRRGDAVLVCGNSRGGANTTYYDVLNPEIMDLIALKNPTTVAHMRIEDIDYAVNINKFFVEKVAKNEDWITISYYYAPDLYDSFYSSDYERFKELYERYEDHPKAKRYKARDIINRILTESVETGRLYIHYIDEANRHTPFKDTIYSSNLCVAPETLILTSEGHKKISELKDQEVDVWNGEEWSTTTVRQTGVDQKLIKIRLSNGVEIDCTPYHKFYIQPSYHGAVIEKEARELEVGDSLIKYDLEAIDIGDDWDYAYLNGFYTGDGSEVTSKKGRVYFYNEKIDLTKIPEFNVGDGNFTEPRSWNNGATRVDREYERGTILKDKFFVPDTSYSIEARMKWLAGFMDADGSVYKNKDNRQLVGVNTNKEFLLNVRYMLQTLGVDSKVTIQRHSGKRLMPLNDGSGDSGFFECKKVYRIIITSNGLYKLVQMGFDKMVHRLDLTDVKRPQRDASQFIKVESIIDEGRYDDTFCFTESKRNMGMFNGVLTGQCLEIALPTKPFTDMMDLYSVAPDGEIGLCSLSSIVVGRTADEEYEDVAYYVALLVDNTIDIMDYPFPALEKTAKSRRSIGIGIANLAYDMAKNKLSYASQEGKEYIHKVAERHAYYLYKASLRLAKEKGNAPWMFKSKYSEGWLPIDTYNRNVDEVVKPEYQYDWEGLRKEIKKQGGIRNSTIIAIPPNESSSLLTNTTNSIYPVRSLKVIKTSASSRNILIAPELEELADYYDIAWDLDSKHLIDMYAIVQKFTDQGISADLYVSYRESQTLSMTKILKDFIYMMKMGCKSRYYINSQSGVDADLYRRGEAEVIDTDEFCDSCVL